MNLRDPVKRANKRSTMVIPSYTTQLTTVEYFLTTSKKGQQQGKAKTSCVANSMKSGRRVRFEACELMKTH